MNILITGATGFLGSYITHRLLSDGYNIFILKRSFSNVAKIESIIKDITAYDLDRVAIEDVFEDNQIDVIIHTATNYGKANVAINEVVESNVVLPLKLLELLAKNSGTAFINTDTFFNNKNTANYEYLNAYALSKKFFLELASIFSIQKNLKFINMRLEHLYGPNDDLSKFTMDIVQKLSSNVESIALTPGKQKRDFIYVTDTIEAYSCVLNNIKKLESSIHHFEVGCGKSVTIAEFVALAKQLTGASTKLNFGAIPYRNNEIMDSFADNRSLLNLGWNCKIGLSDGMLLTIKSIEEKKERAVKINCPLKN